LSVCWPQDFQGHPVNRLSNLLTATTYRFADAMMNSTHIHDTRRTSQRRTAALASIRAARNVNRAWRITATMLGAGIAGVMSGFAIWPPIVSVATVAVSLVVAFAVAWTGAVWVSAPWAGVLWFGGPIMAGLVCAAITRQWPGLGVLAGCLAIVLMSLALYQRDSRR
jgi:hypothetical protein